MEKDKLVTDQMIEQTIAKLKELQELKKRQNTTTSGKFMNDMTRGFGDILDEPKKQEVENPSARHGFVPGEVRGFGDLFTNDDEKGKSK